MYGLSCFVRAVVIFSLLWLTRCLVFLISKVCNNKHKIKASTIRRKLTVYKASAGSGKTFRLTVEYIKIIISEQDSYRKLLAVTFTNKATEEMKSRILTHLYGIANNLQSSESYFQVLKKETNLLDVVIRKRAEEALHQLLHNYHYFNVETIDSFFQRIFRNLIHELQLPGNLRIDLNDAQIEQKAVDTLIEKLRQKDKLLHWIMQFIREKISDDKSWNIISQIKLFGKNIFSQEYKSNSQEISKVLRTEINFNNFRRELHSLYTDAKDVLKNRAEVFFKILNDNAISPDELNGKTRSIATYFTKLLSGDIGESAFIRDSKIEKHISSPEEWAAKTSAKYEQIVKIADQQLCSFLEKTEQERKQLLKICNSVQLTLNNLNFLRLLEYISEEVQTENEDANRFLLSATQDLLAKLIDTSDSPFIYEKIGGGLEHIMIDEFQDTSVLQWNNFKVLINETLSHEQSSCLLVGDVKQSIYRWRNGDWQLLNNIAQEFKHLDDDLVVHSLQKNYRSYSRIVDFNNHFFEIARDEETKRLSSEEIMFANLVTDAYKQDELRQEKPVGANSKQTDAGRISVKLLEKKNYRENTLAVLKDTIYELIESGVEPKEIAILTRYNRDIVDIANYLMKNAPDILVVSDEAFHLNSSIAVKLLIETLYYVTHNEDILSKLFIVKTYQHDILGNDFDDYTLLDYIERVDELLPKEFVHKINQIVMMPLYEMAEYIYYIFNIEKLPGQGAYVSMFFDVLQDYLANNPGNINDFLRTWDDDLYKKSIQIDEAEGIRLLTIHRSKGLEYNHVILPFCDWEDEKHDEIIWCKSDAEPFSSLPIIPITRNKNKMLASVYADSYMQEHLQAAIDNLNLLYVAFTRAARTLNVIGENSKTTGRSGLIKKVLPMLSSFLSGSTYLPSDEMTIFEWGKLQTQENKSDKPNSEDNNNDINIFDRKSEPIYASMLNYRNRTEFKESNASKRFVSEDNNSYIDIGTIMHNLLSEIDNISDIETAIAKYEQDGLLSPATITKESVRKLIDSNLNNTTVRKWFSDDNIVLTEKTIITKSDIDNDVEEYRPDRVIKNGDIITVVDYKFGKPLSEHINQVSRYVDLIRKMGNNNVEGYLWYVYQHKIVKI